MPGPHTRDLSRFVGRARELAILHERLAYATQGQGQVVGLVGEPGIGKSRLLYEFAQSLRGQTVTYREGHCLAYGSATPYLPVRALLRQHCGITEADGPEAITARVCRAVQDAEMASEEGEALLLQLLDVAYGDGAGGAAAARRPSGHARLRSCGSCFYTPVSGSLSSWRWRIAIGSTRHQRNG